MGRLTAVLPISSINTLLGSHQYIHTHMHCLPDPVLTGACQLKVNVFIMYAFSNANLVIRNLFASMKLLYSVVMS